MLTVTTYMHVFMYEECARVLVDSKQRESRVLRPCHPKTPGNAPPTPPNAMYAVLPRATANQSLQQKHRALLAFLPVPLDVSSRHSSHHVMQTS